MILKSKKFMPVERFVALFTRGGFWDKTGACTRALHIDLSLRESTLISVGTWTFWIFQILHRVKLVDVGSHRWELVEDHNPVKVKLYESFGWYTNKSNTRSDLNADFFSKMDRIRDRRISERLFCTECGLMSTMLPLSGDPVGSCNSHVISCEYIKILDIVE